MKINPILKNHILSIIAILIYTGTFGQGAKFDWGKSFTNCRPNAIAFDDSGNIYTTGYYGTSSFTNRTDIFIRKTDANGKFIWNKIIGGKRDESGNSIIVGDSGNVYIIGHFEDKIDFDPGPKVYTMNILNPSSLSGDIFILKLTPGGDFIWAKSFGGYSFDNGTDIIKDKKGNLYISGTTVNPADFDPDTGKYWAGKNAYTENFLLKLNKNGKLIWVKTFGNINYQNALKSVTMDAMGNFYLIGGFRGITDFDLGPDSAILVSYGGKWDNYSDAFILKIDSNGNYLWARKLSGPNDENIYSIAIDDSGGVYIGGTFMDSVDFNPGPDSLKITSKNQLDAFIEKLDTAGNFQWVATIGGYKDQMINDVSVDSLGYIYTMGNYIDTVDLDPGIDTFSVSTLVQNAFYQKFNSKGELIWAKTIKGGFNSGNRLTVRDSGHLFLAGNFYGTLDLDPGPATYNVTTSNYFWDAYILKLQPCQSYNTTDTHVVCGPFKWIDGKTYTKSNYKATHKLYSTQDCDSVVHLHLTINNNSGIDTILACGDYQWIDGKTYTTNNVSTTHTLTNSKGCDSLVRLHLTIKRIEKTDTFKICNSTFNWRNNVAYTASNNTAKDTVKSMNGCDTVFSLNLTIQHQGAATDTIVACDSFIWRNGKVYKENNFNDKDTVDNIGECDSIFTLNLVILHSSSVTDSITACNSYRWINGKLYTQSNYTDEYRLTNAEGCDSIIRLNLNINKVDTGVTTSGSELISNAVNAHYQWLDCSNGHSIMINDTNRKLNPSTSGNFAVEVAQNGCTDTSKCYFISKLDVIRNQFGSDLKTYPNPNNGKFTIELGAVYEQVTAKIISSDGRVLGITTVNKTGLLNMDIAGSSGYYLIEIMATGNKTALIKIFKR